MAPLETLSALEGIDRVFAAFAGGDPRALVEVIAEDAVWRVPGSAPVSREYRGREAIFDLFRATRRLTDGTYLSELRWAARRRRARGRRLPRPRVAPRARARHRPGAPDHPRRDGRWQEIVAVPTDPPAFEAFWG